MPNFEKEAKNSKISDDPKVFAVQNNGNPIKINQNSLVLSENLIKKIENIKFYNQKSNKMKISQSKDQKENERNQENTEFNSANLQTC